MLVEYPKVAGLRDLVRDVYRMYDSTGRSEAVDRLGDIRAKAAALPAESSKALLSALNGPCIEKSLVFLDDPQLPATSNAVERDNRRHRKMQKSVYRVRTLRNLQRRVALEILRAVGTLGRAECLTALHAARRAG